ncbi:MAG TPA: lysophospholipid acyltransferase family protein [Gammaproteobacteria bacterium]|nr:lysophospholipid acyltransferase family protein [Gammaproteobacteria bacterium]
MHVLLGMLLAIAVLILPLRQRLVRGFGPWWLRRGAAILGVKVMVHGSPADEPCVVVANHISWLDILVLATQSDAGFVAKAEVGEWPVLGWMFRAGGTEFVRRGSHDSVARLLQRMTGRLRQGETLTVFPEGTSHGRVLPARFRPRLLQAAVDAGAHVQPVAIYYGADPEVLERVAFVGEDTFLNHLWRLLGADPVLAEVTYLPPLASVTGDSRLLADEAWRAVSHTLSRLELFELESQRGHGVRAVTLTTHAA